MITDPVGDLIIRLKNAGAINKESISADALATLIARPGMVFSAAPQNLLPAAQFFSRAGYIKQKPTSWKEFFFDEVHDLPGS